jgi:hypothetical protein
MYFHRFDEPTREPDETPAQSPFVIIPINCQGAEWWQWVYERAFVEAQMNMLADFRARMLTASLN